LLDIKVRRLEVTEMADQLPFGDDAVAPHPRLIPGS